jgi:hypothetical protein
MKYELKSVRNGYSALTYIFTSMSIQHKPNGIEKQGWRLRSTEIADGTHAQEQITQLLRSEAKSSSLIKHSIEISREMKKSKHLKP